ncbi:ABC transporter ATP-binding protein [Micromonospora sp. CPCC 206061]|uniref:ABC transporter ATP-binding protein n=1 Tax=Micromonospora sp. CPCC 206061 TaxID=3122410 RepID=UPI002FF0438A
MLTVVWRAARLLDPSSRRGLLLGIPVALAVTLLELAGFVALAAVVQVLAVPQLLHEAGPDTLVGLARRAARPHGLTDFVAIVGGVAVTLLVARGVAATALAWWQAGLLASAEAALSAKLFRAFMGTSYEFHLQHHSADLMRTAIQSVRSLTSRVLLPATTIIVDASLILGLAMALLVMEPMTALVSIGALGGAMGMYLFLVRRSARRMGVEDERLMSRDQRLIQEGLRTVKMLTTLDRRDTVVRRFETARSEHAYALRGLFFVSNMSRYYLEAVVLIVVTAAAGMAILGSADRALASVGVMLAGSMRLLPSVQRLISTINIVRVGAGSLEQVEMDLAAADNDIKRSAAHVDPRPVTFERRIEFRELTYRYPAAATPALDSINLTVNIGESVGIVGPSGSGKTTLVDVLLGLLPPIAGGIYVDGAKITPELVHRWRARIGYVPQETVVIDDTVRRNVALGLDDDEIDDVAIERAIAQAQLLDTVLAMPDGFDSVLGEHGVRLSGGQRQRIGIARALYRQPDVLVLDEATAALDTETERQIVETIEKMYGKITVFVIAHRLSTVQRCDTHVVLNRGRVASTGGADPQPGGQPKSPVLTTAYPQRRAETEG